MRHISFIRIFAVCVLSNLSLEIPAQPGRVRANGITIAYESFGDKNAEAIIMIQGTGATLLHYPAQLCEKLAAEGYHVIRFDNRDIGLSSKLDSLGTPDWKSIFPLIGTCKPAPLPYTLLDMAKDVIGMMDGFQISKANIVGASMGGAIAQLIAIHFPERVRTLTTLGASSGNPGLPKADQNAIAAMTTPPPATDNKDTLTRYLVHIYKALGAVDDDSVLRKRAMEHINRAWYPQGTARQAAAIIIADNCDRRDLLSKIKIPTMIIHGKNDPLVKVDAAKELAKTIPGAQLCIIEGLGHDISLKYVDKIAECITRIVKK